MRIGSTTQTIATSSTMMMRITTTIAQARLSPRRSNHRTSGSRATVTKAATKIDSTIPRSP